MSDPITAGPASRTATSSLDPILELLQTAERSAAENGFSNPRLQEAYRAQMLMIMSAAYVEVFGTDVESPDWVPYIPYYLARAAPNPDTVYGFAPIDPRGTYRIYGEKGTETIAAITFRKGGAHLGQRCTARVGEIDFQSVEADAAGRFNFVLSAQRPGDHAGQWFELHPETTCLMLRRVTKNATQRDGVCGIERLDRPRARLALTAEELRERMMNVARYTASHNEFLLGYLKRLRQLGAEERFVLDDQSGAGGLIVQSHYFHMFSIETDEALILESNLPKLCRYWSIQVMNPFASTIDYVLHQSSLNDHQAQVDADGKVRMVLALSDPGVANWLDTGGWTEGGVQWRWNDVDVSPYPSVTRIKLRDLWRHLPAQTARMDPAARAASLSARAAYYQCRRR